MHTRLLVLLALGMLAAAPAASGDGGPSPGSISGWDGVLAPGGNVRYVALASGPGTTVAAVRVRGGRVLNYRSLGGFYGVPIVAYDGSTGGVSADGKTLVLATYTSVPSARSVTRLAVLATKSLRARRLVTLRGSYSFDAISPGGRTVYLIQYTSSKDWTRYRVRALDSKTGRLLPGAIVDRREPGEQMHGAPMTRASSRDGGWAYTLYARATAPAFVHALDTRHRTAFCIDLPWTADPQTATHVRMRVGGRKLVIHNGTARLATVDTTTWKVTS